MAGDATLQPQGRKKCFVVMGFGIKTDLATGRNIDLNKVYKNLIKPVVVERGLDCVRADEIQHSGVIDVPMYRELLMADFVIADISTANANAIYELGIRHALRPHTTIVMSEDRLVYPFDLNHVLISSYKYLDGGGIDFDEVIRFRELLGRKLDELLREPKVDSPVYTFIKDLAPPKVAEQITRVAASLELATAASPAALEPDPGQHPQWTLASLVERGEEAMGRGDFEAARDHFAEALRNCRAASKAGVCDYRDDPYLIQRRALATYKAKQPDRESSVAALHEALGLLEPLKPHESNDPETVGLAGAIEKRLFEHGQGVEHLEDAIRYYARGYYLKDDYYNGINLAYLHNQRVDTSLDPTESEKVADLVVANRIRREVLPHCHRELEAIRTRARRAEHAHAPGDAQIFRAQQSSDAASEFWCLATMAEAHFGLGAMTDYEATRKEALALTPAPDPWMVESFEKQIASLHRLLESHGHRLEPPWPGAPGRA